MDGPSGKQLVLLNFEEFPFYQQVRLIASYFRLGSEAAAEALLAACSNAKLDEAVRVFAGSVQRWSMPMDTDPVLGHYRPTFKRAFSKTDLIAKHSTEIRSC